jgi:NADH-quinone oxidoreductase subunit L
MTHSILISVLLIAPLIGFLINGLRYNKATPFIAGGIAATAAAVSFLASVGLFVILMGLPKPASLEFQLAEWIKVGSLSVPFGFAVDALSSLMILIVTGVGTLIHLFSISYMKEDEGVSRYFAYLNFFLFNMLILVTADNLLLLFVGWEGVGLCSYLLIGFWYQDMDKAAAGMKAFITNRIGDAAFLLGLFILFFQFGTVNFQALNAMAPDSPILDWANPLTMATLFLFVGATGKSAQIPLYVWLPDAMAGPTPVSALIHAATMVTAGVYLIVRMNPIFVMTPNTLMVVAIVGLATALVAASIGLTQWDIKKVLAYSTVSQLGFMFMACGVGAFAAAFFHLMTHAFFKALMFLGSGSIIHAMHHEQDIRKMGGLKAFMPVTYFTFLMGWLAIMGIPPFSGFFSKDEILWLSFHSPMGHPVLWLGLAMAAFMTAFYMTRMVALVFWGKTRAEDPEHIHESPWLMTVPLVVLAVLSVVGGLLGIPHVISEILPGHPPNLLEAWFNGLIRPIPNITKANVAVEWLLISVSLVLAVIAISTATIFYVKQPHLPKKISKSLGGFYRLVHDKYRVDEAYEQGIIQPLVQFSRGLWFYFDVRIVDRLCMSLSGLAISGGQFVRFLQNGSIQSYLSFMVVGLVLALLMFFVN